MKSKSIKIISAVMAASVLLLTCGCQKGNKSGDKKEMLNMPKVEASSAVIEYTSVNEQDGSKVDATRIDENVIDNSVNKVSLGVTLEEKLENSIEKQLLEEHLGNYGLNKDKYDELVKDGENWQEFTYSVYVANSSDSRISFEMITHKDNSGVYLNNYLDCEYGINPGYSCYATISGLIDKTKYTDEAAVKAILKEMGVQIVYAQIGGIDDTIEDWESANTYTMDIDFDR